VTDSDRDQCGCGISTQNNPAHLFQTPPRIFDLPARRASRQSHFHRLRLSNPRHYSPHIVTGRVDYSPRSSRHDALKAGRDGPEHFVDVNSMVPMMMFGPCVGTRHEKDAQQHARETGSYSHRITL
jgi:hypothetical protein